MARKNKSARQRNIKGRLDRREFGTKRRASSAQGARTLDLMVIPDGQCDGNPRRPKAIFATEEKAAKALAHAQIQRKRTGSTHMEKRYYLCNDCEGYHLTSREAFNPRPGRPA